MPTPAAIRHKKIKVSNAGKITVAALCCSVGAGATAADRPIRDAQMTARIPSGLLRSFIHRKGEKGCALP
jgi:hypothetical protein